MSEDKGKGAMGKSQVRSKRETRETPMMKEKRKAMQKQRPSVIRKGTRGY